MSLSSDRCRSYDRPAQSLFLGCHKLILTGSGPDLPTSHGFIFHQFLQGRSERGFFRAFGEARCDSDCAAHVPESEGSVTDGPDHVFETSDMITRVIGVGSSSRVRYSCDLRTSTERVT